MPEGKNWREYVDAGLERRAELVDEMRTVRESDVIPDGVKLKRIGKLDDEVVVLETHIRDLIERGQREEGAAEAFAKAGKLVDPRARRSNGDAEWRSLLPSGDEFRELVSTVNPGDGGYTVPEMVARTYVDRLRAQSVFLKAPGLNVIPFEGGLFRLPQLGASTEPGVTPEGAPIPEGEIDWLGHEFKPYKYATLYKASSEILADSAISMRDALSNTMIRDITGKVDRDAFGNATTGTLMGLTAAGQHTKVALPSGSTAVKWDHVVDAVSDIEATGGVATVVWCSPDMAKALRKERESGTTGAYLAGSVTTDPVRTAQGLPLLPSNNLPGRSVIVADASRVFFGVRSDVALMVSEHAYFANDVVGFRLTFRAAGIVVAEATSVRWIQASAN